MCGIVGYVGHTERAQDVILDGLKRLPYQAAHMRRRCDPR